MTAVSRVAVSSVALLALLCGCQEPTQITIEVSTDVDCGLDINTGINVGALGEIDGKPPGSTKSACESSGRIGSLVAVPDGSGPDEVGFRIVTSVGVPLSECETPTEGDSCIVSRRALGYLDNKKLLVPVVQRDACIGVPCDEKTTCVRGDCVDASIDPNLCLDADGCGEDELTGGGGEGGGGGAGGAGGGGGAGGSVSLAHDWSERYGTTGSYDRGTALVLDDTGDVKVALGTSGGFSVNGVGVADMAIMNLSHSGPTPPNWVYTNSSGATSVMGLARNALGQLFFVGSAGIDGDYGGGPVTVQSDSDILFGSISGASAYRWAEAYGSQGLNVFNFASDVAVDSAGNVYVAGFTGPAQMAVAIGGTGVPPSTLFVAHLNPVDGFPTVIALGSCLFATAKLAIDGNDNLYVAGQFQGDLGLGNGAPSIGSDDLFVAHIQPTGPNVAQPQWLNAFGTTASDTFTDLAVSSDGNIYITGSYVNPPNFGGGALDDGAGEDGFIASFDQSGMHRWSHGIATDGVDNAQAVAVSASGDVVMAVRLGTEVVLKSYTADGLSVRWELPFPAPADLTFHDLEVGPSNEVVGTGEFSGSISFDGGATQFTSSDLDAFVARFTQQ
jgi:hypothetical protein